MRILTQEQNFNKRSIKKPLHGQWGQLGPTIKSNGTSGTLILRMNFCLCHTNIAQVKHEVIQDFQVTRTCVEHMRACRAQKHRSVIWHCLFYLLNHDTSQSDCDLKNQPLVTGLRLMRSRL